MAPYHPRQLFLLTIPTLAALLSYFWYKKKRIGIESDLCDKNNSQEERIDFNQERSSTPIKITAEETKIAESPVSEKSFSRSLSGVDSAPIDIILPKDHRAKIAPVISDEDLDLEIEKIKLMKNSMEPYNKFKSTTPTKPVTEKMKSPPIKEMTTPSPKKSNTVNAVSTSKKNNTNKKNNKNGFQHQPVKQTETETKNKDNIEKEVTASQSKLCDLKIGNGKEKSKNKKKQVKEKENKKESVEKENDIQRQSSERDSANHSPSDVMLASPSLSSISDNHSEVNSRQQSLKYL